MLYKLILALVLLFIFFQHTQSQSYTIKGKIIDSETFETVPFASIMLKKHPTHSTLSSMDGEFTIKLPHGSSDSLLISSIGYMPLITRVDEKTPKPIVIELTRQATQLKEIVITPFDNPAHRIILNAVRNRKINNPDNLPSYSCNIYNRLSLSFIPNHPDSLKKRRLFKLSDKYMMVSESYISRTYQYPKQLKEIIERIKVSGFRSPSYAPMATDYQPFHFYEDNLSILDKVYLNPISPGSIHKYVFTIEDTLYSGNDSIFILSFHPRKSTNFEGLKGSISINTNQFAIQTINAEPAGETIWKFKIQQKYELVNDTTWFPAELNYELRLDKYPTKTMGTEISGKSYVTNTNLKPDLQNVKFDENVSVLSDSANYSDTAFWQKTRINVLSDKEKISYQKIDSVGIARHFDDKLHFLEKILDLKIPLTIIDLELDKMLVANIYEKYRFGLGIITNEKVSPYFAVGGYLGYGNKDKAWKHGVNFDIMPTKKKDFRFRFLYASDLTEPTWYNLKFDVSTYFRRDLDVWRMNKTIEKSAILDYRYRYVKLNFRFGTFHRIADPAGEYLDVIHGNHVENYTEMDIRLKYAYKEKIIRAFGQSYSNGTDYPEFYFSYTRGFSKLLNGQAAYNKYSFNFNKSFETRNVGYSSIDFTTGIIDRGVPYSRLFSSSGSYVLGNPYYVDKTFQTMGLYEFASTSFVNLFLSHNFHSLLFSRKSFKPEVNIIQGIAYGKLSHSERYIADGTKSLDKGYFESGMMINNIIKAKCLNLIYIGMGTGAFYRYGYYSKIGFRNNVAAKWSVTFSL
jgi:hypothetical protein